MKSSRLTFLLAVAMFAAAAGPSHATETVTTKHVTARIVADVRAVEPGGTFTIGINQKIIPRWHTYWINPGDSGLATSIAWTLPEGAKAGEIEWPAPKKINIAHLANYGYENEVTLLTKITVPENVRAGGTFPVKAVVDWLVCEEICIPEQVTLELNLPVVARGMSAGISERSIEAARNSLPEDVSWTFEAKAANGKLLFAFTPQGIAPEQINNPFFFASEWGVSEHAAPQPVSVENGKLTMAIKPSQTKLPPQLRGVLVFEDRSAGTPLLRAVNVNTGIDGAIAPTTPLGMMTMSEIGFFTALLFALLGGIILNLMPCVFPVLSLKILWLVNHSRASAHQRRLQGWSYTAGVLACFGAFAAIVLAFKAGGAQLGWGFQFQSPLFVLLLAYVMFAVGLTQSGLLTFGTSLTRLGFAGTKGGYAESFLTGALAAVVATPCTAPFMGAALGFAVAQPAPILLSIFLALGFGLALPYLVLCYWPALLRFLPKPGVWMERFKQFLAFPMYAVAVWLVWVLAQQAGANAVAAALGGMVLIAFGAWLLSSHTRLKFWRRVNASLAAIAIVFAVGIGAMAAMDPQPVQQANNPNARYQAFTPAKLDELRASGRPVFVNLTAAWCLTCIVNERIALDRAEVMTAFENNNIAYLKGDWTHRDPAITELLTKFGRSGVPLYVFYPAGANSTPVVLPQILTTDIVLREIGSRINQASTNQPTLGERR
ncbi:MAG TPA: protein-disulfide reductase DsbD family protein [Xanthobacteraceae bacterium]|nr:protein-disulfide reductase DsbD family protein [Xanthobacteraceae bacterium]